uniref:Uncharacterized protein n=1 Tax=Anguilla anguilla TaxID=7936 RepID=A0A0E9WYK7_ANGAN
MSTVKTPIHFTYIQQQFLYHRQFFQLTSLNNELFYWVLRLSV